jgi:hypothetical protein
VQDLFYYLEINLSLPRDGEKIIDDLDFDTMFEQTIFKSKQKLAWIIYSSMRRGFDL